MKTFIAAAASTSARWGETQKNIAKAVAEMEIASTAGAKLLLLPECCLTGGDWPTGAKAPKVEATALRVNGPELKQIETVAKKNRITVAVGFYENLRGALRITQALVGPNGIVGVYRKTHEGKKSSQDRELFPVFDLGFAKVGISVCRDNMLPECSRILALKGAEVLLSPFMGLPLSRKGWELMRLTALRVRAQDNRLFVISASHAQPHVPGRPKEWGYSGVCCAVNPLGEVMNVSKGNPGTPQRVVVKLEEALTRTYLLADVPAIRDRRAGDYREICDVRLQNCYRDRAPEFLYNEKFDRAVIRKGALRAARRLPA